MKCRECHAPITARHARCGWCGTYAPQQESLLARGTAIALIGAIVLGFLFAALTR